MDGLKTIDGILSILAGTLVGIAKRWHENRLVIVGVVAIVPGIIVERIDIDALQTIKDVVESSVVGFVLIGLGIGSVIVGLVLKTDAQTQDEFFRTIPIPEESLFESVVAFVKALGEYIGKRRKTS